MPLYILAQYPSTAAGLHDAHKTAHDAAVGTKHTYAVIKQGYDYVVVPDWQVNVCRRVDTAGVSDLSNCVCRYHDATVGRQTTIIDDVPNVTAKSVDRVQRRVQNAPIDLTKVAEDAARIAQEAI